MEAGLWSTKLLAFVRHSPAYYCFMAEGRVLNSGLVYRSMLAGERRFCCSKDQELSLQQQTAFLCGGATTPDG